MKAGTINLAAVRTFGGVVPLSGLMTIQMLSTNLSGNTTFSVQTSLDKMNWDIIQVNDADYQGTLVDDAAFVQTFNLGPSIYFRVVLDGATTGSVEYKHNGL
jgi:hypothetical protein